MNNSHLHKIKSILLWILLAVAFKMLYMRVSISLEHSNVPECINEFCLWSSGQRWGAETSANSNICLPAWLLRYKGRRRGCHYVTEAFNTNLWFLSHFFGIFTFIVIVDCLLPRKKVTLSATMSLPLNLKRPCMTYSVGFHCSIGYNWRKPFIMTFIVLSSK